MYNWSQSLIKLIITLWWKPRRVFLPFHFVGEKPRGGFPPRVFFYFAWKASNDEKNFNSASILFCKAIQLKTNLFIFSKNPAGFFPHNLKWEKNPAGEIKGWNWALPIIFWNNYNQTNLFLELILIFIFLKKPCGVFPPFENVGEKPRAGF